MRREFLFVSAVVGIVVLQACAPKPEPILPEPIFDKYGEAVGTDLVCRPQRQPVSPNYPERLPICEQQCPPGTMLNPQLSVAAAARNPECVRIPDTNDNDDPQRGQGVN
jgi:hypothetical protein